MKQNVFDCNKVLLQPLRWCWVKCVIYHERDVREEQYHTYMWREQAIKEWSWRGSSADINVWKIERNDQRTRRVIMACELYCCLLPQCEALRPCHSGFPIATVSRKGISGIICHTWTTK